MNPLHPKNEERFHPKSSPCPFCGNVAEPNKALASVALNAHLYGQVEKQDAEIRQVGEARREWNG